MSHPTDASLDSSERSDTAMTTRQRGLVLLLHDKYGVSRDDTTGIDRTRLMRLIDTFDFLTNNLPPQSLATPIANRLR